jgi:two-component SAPR family response regulator
MKVLIIEDEKIAANNLEKMLRQIDSNIYIQSKIDTIEGTVKWLHNNKTDPVKANRNSGIRAEFK